MYISRARGSIPAILFVMLATASQAAPESNDEPKPEPRFDVLEYRVLGNTALAPRDIESAVYPFLGPDKALADVEQARVALENAYRASGRGTVFVDIPEQDVGDDGVVRLKVTEGRLRQVRVQGARYFSGRAIKEALPSAAPDAVPDLPQLQRDISALNLESADRRIVPVLAAGTVPGTVNLTLRVEDDLPLHGSLEVNDQYTADTSELRAIGALSYDNLFGRFDSFGIQYQTTPEEPSELGVLVANYTHNLGSGRRLSFFFVDSNSEVPALNTFGVLGKGQVYGTRLILPFEAGADSNHVLTVGADYKDFSESIRLDSDNSFQTPISYLQFSLASNNTWRFGAQTLTFDPAINFGVMDLGNSTQEFANKRYRGRPSYLYLRASSNYRSAPWRGFSLAASFGGQYSLDPVVANEQFAIGGADSVRGYLEAEELGDLGFKASAQLETPAWRVDALRSALVGYAFFDAGVVSVAYPLPDEVRNADLSSWGVGFRLSLFDHVSAQFSWAYPLVPGPRTDVGDSRWLFMTRVAW
jgi:hemolysin activation/secretion protein